MQVLHYKHNSQEVHLHLCMHFCSWYACIFVAGMHAFLWLVSIPLRVVGIFSLRIFCKGFILSKNSSVHKHWSKSVTSPSATFSKTEQNKTKQITTESETWWLFCQLTPYILLKFLIVLMRRICLMIRGFLNWWSFPSFSFLIFSWKVKTDGKLYVCYLLKNIKLIL